MEKKEANNCDGNDDDISIHPQDKQGNSITMIDAIIYDDKDNDTTSAAELAAAAALALARVVVLAVEKKAGG